MSILPQFRASEEACHSHQHSTKMYWLELWELCHATFNGRSEQALSSSGGNTPKFRGTKTIRTPEHRQRRKPELTNAKSIVHVSETLKHNPSHGTVRNAAIQYLL